MSGPVRGNALHARVAARGARWLAGACVYAVALGAPAQAQNNAASNADSAPRGAAFESALARKKDAETLLALSADGQTLYEHDTVKLDGFGYCGQALALAEQGEFRQSIR